MASFSASPLHVRAVRVPGHAEQLLDNPDLRIGLL
jgi:hypothetical protein